MAHEPVNVKMRRSKKNPDIFIFEVDTSVKGEVSSTGKSVVLAAVFQHYPEGEDFGVNLNVFRPLKPKNKKVKE